MANTFPVQVVNGRRALLDISGAPLIPLLDRSLEASSSGSCKRSTGVNLRPRIQANQTQQGLKRSAAVFCPIVSAVRDMQADRDPRDSVYITVGNDLPDKVLLNDLDNSCDVHDPIKLRIKPDHLVLFELFPDLITK